MVNTQLIYYWIFAILTSAAAGNSLFIPNTFIADTLTLLGWKSVRLLSPGNSYECPRVQKDLAGHDIQSLCILEKHSHRLGDLNLPVVVIPENRHPINMTLFHEVLVTVEVPYKVLLFVNTTETFGEIDRELKELKLTSAFYVAIGDQEKIFCVFTFRDQERVAKTLLKRDPHSGVVNLDSLDLQVSICIDPLAF